MSQRLINLSPDLQRLQNEGFSIQIKAGCLVVHGIPYVDENRSLQHGIFVCKIRLQADHTDKPDDHVMWWCGSHPCNHEGKRLTQLVNESRDNDFGESLVAQHSFSHKLRDPEMRQYVDYYEKVTTYASVLHQFAAKIDPDCTPCSFNVIEADDQESVFKYIDTATSRAQIGSVTQKLAVDKVAIVGLGGTGSYVLDLLAKTPIKEIHLFDGDQFSQHNAFRCPGAPSIDELKKKQCKVDYFAEIYSKMRRGVIPHSGYIDETNVGQLIGFNCVFLCLDDGTAKKLIVDSLIGNVTDFIDVGMGIHLTNGALLGMLSVTTSTAAKNDHVYNRITFGSGDANNEYSTNIQIADLNALNAALAIARWKRLRGFYADMQHEYFSAYDVEGNHMGNAEQI